MAWFFRAMQICIKRISYWLHLAQQWPLDHCWFLELHDAVPLETVQYNKVEFLLGQACVGYCLVVLMSHILHGMCGHPIAFCLFITAVTYERNFWSSRLGFSFLEQSWF